jgi:hypothetical protein
MHIHGRRVLRDWGIVAGVAALLIASAAAAQEEERPKIFLEKKIFADTSGGKKSFYEVHAVSEGESLWKILSRRSPLTPEEYIPLLKEFRRANPGVANPGKLKAGQKILIPSLLPAAQTDPRVGGGRAVPHRVAKGDNLTKLLKTRKVSRAELPKYLNAVKELNESIRDVNRILAGRTILLPTDRYFAPEPEKPRETAAREAPKEDSKEGAPGTSPELPVVALSRDVAPEPLPAAAEPAKPEAQLRASAAPQPAVPVVMTAPEPAKKEVPALLPPKPPYRGLLTDLLTGLGEKWVDRGTLYLPVPSGGEVVLNLEDFPIARFSNGTQALIDFRGTMPEKIRALILETWKNYRVVSFEGTANAGEMVHRLLQGSGYHSVKEGISHPLVIGEGVSVTLPARWVVLRTPDSLLKGEVILVKEVPEKPTGDLVAVLRYADRVGIRVLPYATDPSALEGFLVGVGEAREEVEPPRLAVPSAGLPALDFALDYLGLPKKEGERMTIGGKGDAFRLVIQPDRLFETGGRRYVVDTGKMAPALRTIVRDSGFSVFPVGKDDTGKGIFQRLLKEAGISSEVRKGFPVSGGDKEGYSVRVTGMFLTSAEWLEARKLREAVLFAGRTHTATRTLLRDLGVEIVEW